jgi:DNA-binding transcriptional LysR family regulator
LGEFDKLTMGWVTSADYLVMDVFRAMGIVMLPEIMLSQDVESGRLVCLLPDYTPPTRPLNLLYVRDRRMSPKLRSFVDFVVDRFSAQS